MSLRVWLPLTKDLRNQGLDNLVPALMGNGITYTAGKLGYAATFPNNANSCINMPGLKLQEGSWCAWIKIAGEGSSSSQYIISEGRDMGSVGMNIYASKAGTTVYFTVHKIGFSFSVELNKWFHIAGIFGNGTVSVYIDGELKSTKAYTVDSDYAQSDDHFVLGKMAYGYTLTGSYFPFNGQLNDVRIYDHCLSPMEVKEISKGLVLHYPLNRGGWGQENLLSNDKSNWGAYTCNSGKYNANGNRFAPYQITIPILPSTKYICHIVDDLKIGQQFYIGVHQLSSDLTFLNDSGWKAIPYSFTSLENAAYVRLVFRDALNNAANISNYLDNIGEKILIKFEKGSIATPWCPNSSDTLATTMGLNSTTEYDCSGFCNNGTKWAYDAEGVISYTSDAPKYNTSTFIDSTNNTTNTASGTRYIYGNCELTAPQYLTVAFWCKPIAGYNGGTTQGQFSLTNYVIGTSAGQDYNTAPMNHRDSYIDMCTSSGVHKTVTISFTANEWHHYVIIYDGRYGRIYKDGVATSAILDMGSVLPLSDMKGAVIGFSKAGGVWRSNKSYYSDFRIYTTALSADDIKSLYQNSAYIDSSGNIYGAVHEEV